MSQETLGHTTDPYVVGKSHPPYAVRNKFLLRAIRRVGWHIPVTNTGHGSTNKAEKAFLQSTFDDQFDAWADLFTDAQIDDAIKGVRQLLDGGKRLAYETMPGDMLKTLVERIASGVPPTFSTVDADGNPELRELRVEQILYAGWVYWEGRNHVQCDIPLTFFQTNRLCDQALLQQRAVDLFLAAGGS